MLSKLNRVQNICVHKEMYRCKRNRRSNQQRKKADEDGKWKKTMNKGLAEKLGEGTQRKREINKYMTGMEKGQEERRMNKNRRVE